MSIESDILADLQTRTQSEAELLAMVEAGRDADVAGWYHDQAGTSITQPHDLTYTDLARMMGAARVSQVRAAAEQSQVTGAADLVKIIDAGAALPLMAPGNDTFIASLSTGGVITEQEASVLASLSVRARTLDEQLFGRTISASDVSDALRSVRVGSTATLIENWQTWSPE